MSVNIRKSGRLLYNVLDWIGEGFSPFLANFAQEHPARHPLLRNIITRRGITLMHKVPSSKNDLTPFYEDIIAAQGIVLVYPTHNYNS